MTSSNMNKGPRKSPNKTVLPGMLVILVPRKQRQKDHSVRSLWAT